MSYFPGSAFNPYKSQQASYPTPVPFPVIDLGKTLSVSFQAAWLPYILGSLKQLIQNSTFDASSAEEQESHILQAYDLLKVFQHAQAANVPFINPVQESEVEMSLCEQLRYHGGKLQALCCGDWVDIGSDDNTAPNGQGGQPGGGQPQPPDNGGSQCYDGEFAASGVFNVPTVVNTGDVITLQSASGAGAVSPTTDWYCIDGSQFFAGACVGFTHLDGTDPAPTIAHGHLLYLIAGTYYAATVGSPLTVPSVPANSPVLVLANFTSSTLQGGYKVSVCVQNNQAGSWTQQFDFTKSPSGWVVSTGEGGHWEAGVGFVSDQAQPSDGDQITIEYTTIPSGTYTAWSVKVNCTSNTNQTADAYYNGSTTDFIPTSTGIHEYSPSNVPIVGQQLQVNLANRPSSATDEYTILGATITGTGVNPF